MRNNRNPYASVAIMLAASALAGFAFAFVARKTLRDLRAELARQRFRVVRGSLRDASSAENIHLLSDD